MTTLRIEAIRAELELAGRKMWDNAIDASASYVEAAYLDGKSIDDIVKGIRRLSFAVTPRPSQQAGEGQEKKP